MSGEKPSRLQWAAPVIAALITASAVVIAAQISADAKRQVEALKTENESLKGSLASMQQDLTLVKERQSGATYAAPGRPSSPDSKRSVQQEHPSQRGPQETSGSSTTVSLSNLDSGQQQGGSASPREDKKPPSPQVREAEGIRFMLNFCESVEGGVACELSVTNNSRNRTLRISEILLFDKTGKAYSPDSINVGGEGPSSLGGISKYLVQDAEVPARIVVGDFPENADVILEIKIDARADITEEGKLDILGYKFQIRFRNVALR